jgi:hypothetical protein
MASSSCARNPKQNSSTTRHHIFEGTTMSAVIATLLVFAARVNGQLNSPEYMALMSFWAGLKCNDATICPRFAANAACPAVPSLRCVGGSVTSMYVIVSMPIFSHSGSSELPNQNLVGSIGSDIGQLKRLTYL